MNTPEQNAREADKTVGDLANKWREPGTVNPLGAIMSDEHWAQAELATVLSEVQMVVDWIEIMDDAIRVSDFVDICKRLRAILSPNNRTALVDKYRQQGWN